MFLGSCKIASKLTPCAEAPLRNFLSLVMVCIPILSPVPKITISFSCSFLVGFNFLALPDGLSGANSTHKCNFLNYTPAGASLQLVPNSEFTILSPSYLSHSSHLPHSSHLSQPSQPSHSSHQSNPSHTSHLSHSSHLSHLS